MIDKKEKAKRLNALFGFIGKSMQVYAVNQSARNRPGPDLEHVNSLVERTQKGKLPIVIEEGSYLSKNGNFLTKGEFQRLVKGGMQVGEFIRIPANLFNEDGSFNPEQVAVLVHELGHALQNEALKDMPESVRRKISVAETEHYNQALAIGVWDHMSHIQKANEKSDFWGAKQELAKLYGEDLNLLPEINTETMKYQDRVSKFPGSSYLRRVDPELYEDFYEGAGINVKLKEDAAPLRDFMKQLQADKKKIDVNQRIMQEILETHSQGDFVDYINSRNQTVTNVLNKFKPIAQVPESDHELVEFYKQELNVLGSLAKLEKLREQFHDTKLPVSELENLHDYAVKQQFSDLLNHKHQEDLIDFVAAHKIGELEANRALLEDPRAIEQRLGGYLRKQHEMGFFPEDHMEWLAKGDPKKQKVLEDIRVRARERAKGFSVDQVERRFGGTKEREFGKPKKKERRTKQRGPLK